MLKKDPLKLEQMQRMEMECLLCEESLDHTGFLWQNEGRNDV